MVIQLNKKLTKAFYFKAMSEVELGMFDLACLDFERASDFLDAKEKQKKYCQ